MCYYKLHIFLDCGHSTFSEMPVGFCKAAKDVSVRFSGSRQQRTSTLSTTSSIYSRTDSMEAEEQRDSKHAWTTKAIRPCTEGQIHPLQTRRLERLCAVCQYERDKRLEALKSRNGEIHFEPWRWQFKYQGGSTSTQQKDPSKAAVSNAESGITWDVTTTLNSLMTGSSSWMKDWKRQGSDAVN